MNQIQNIIKHIKGKHLNFAQRMIIQIRTQDGWSPYRIAKELACSSNTIRNELKRGTPDLYWGKQKKYDAVIAQEIYEGHRMNSHRTPSFQKVRRFLKVVELRFRQEHWSFDACVGYSRRNREFTPQEIVHIPDKHFKMIRYYGIYNSSVSLSPTVQNARLIPAIHPSKHAFLRSLTLWRLSLLSSFSSDPLRCPCGCTMEFLFLRHKKTTLDNLLRKVLSYP